MNDRQESDKVIMEELKNNAQSRMQKAVELLKSDFQKVRTGRANPGMLEGINADYYGNPTPLNQVGNISAPEPQLIVITPWEKSMLGEIEKAIMKADLGITPQNDGNVVRLPIPPLTEERRKDLVKQVRKMGEETKLSIRNVRRDANDSLKKMLKDKEITEDDEKRELAVIQKITDEQIAKVDSQIADKEKELMAL